LNFWISAIGLIGISVLACLGIGISPKHPTLVAAFLGAGSGFADAARAAETADAQIVRQGAVPSIWVFASDRPGLAGRLYAQGAWLVLDPIVGGCGDRVPAVGHRTAHSEL
jgi:hypothetical protein